MDLTSINSVIDSAFNAALATPQKQASAPVDGDPNQTVQTVVYEAPTGSGFRVIGRIKSGRYTAMRVRNHGPDTSSEREWPVEGIEAAAAAHEVMLLSRIPVLTPRQFSEKLIREDLLTTVEGMFAAIPDALEKAVAQNWLAKSQTVERNHPMVIAFGAALGMTPDQIDTFFREAAKL